MMELYSLFLGIQQIGSACVRMIKASSMNSRNRNSLVAIMPRMRLASKPATCSRVLR